MYRKMLKTHRNYVIPVETTNYSSVMRFAYLSVFNFIALVKLLFYIY